MRQLGCERQVISADEAVRIEPALAHIRPQLAGATYTAEDESGDANLFVRELARLCERAGVRFQMGAHITALRTAGGEIDHVELTNAEGRFERMRGDAYVLAMARSARCWPSRWASACPSTQPRAIRSRCR
jgi:D-amino-acid dehydrogenase